MNNKTLALALISCLLVSPCIVNAHDDLKSSSFKSTIQAYAPSAKKIALGSLCLWGGLIHNYVNFQKLGSYNEYIKQFYPNKSNEYAIINGPLKSFAQLWAPVWVGTSLLLHGSGQAMKLYIKRNKWHLVKKAMC